MESLTYVLERLFRNQIVPALVRVYTDLFGLETDINLPLETIYSGTLGQWDGLHSIDFSTTRTQKLLIVEDPYDFTVQSPSEVGPDKPMVAYTDSFNELKPGSLLSVHRQDGRVLKYRVEDQTTIGETTNIVIKYRLSYIEE